MNFAFNTKWFNFSVGEKTQSPTVTDLLRGGNDSLEGGAQLNIAYNQSSWVYIAVSVLAENLAQIPFRISKIENEGMRRRLRALRGTTDPRARDWRKRVLGENIIETGPCVELFDEPHPTMDRTLFFETLMTHRALRGEFFVLPLDKDDQPVDLGSRTPRIRRMIALEPGLFYHLVRGYNLEAWRYTGSPLLTPIESQMLLPTEVIHSRTPNPYGFYWRGMSPLLLATLPASSDYAIEQFIKGLMMNNADTGVIVTTDQQPEQDQRDSIMAALRERKRKAGTPDRPLFLWGGAKVEKPSLSLADQQVLETRKMNREQIAAIWKVPSSLMGFSDDKSSALNGGGGAINADRLTFIENTITPHARRIEAALDPIVESFDPTYEGWFDVDCLPIMQEARRSRLTSAAQAFAMGVPFNDCNQVYDLGFREFDWGNTGYLPFSLQPAGSAPAETVPEPEDDAEENLVAVADAFFQKLLRDKPETGNRKPATHVCAPDPAFEASIAGSIKLKAGKLSKFFFEQRGRVLGKLANALKSGAHGVTRPTTKAAWDELFNLPAENKTLVEKLRALLVNDLEFGGAQLFQEIGLGKYDLAPKDATAFLAKRLPKIQEINATTWDRLKASLTEGFNAGEGYEAMAERVKTVYGASQGRADTIAITETNTAINGGRHTAMQRAEVPRKGWKTARLETTRLTHLANEEFSNANKGIPTTDKWPNGLLYPGDPDGEAGETINCRCFTYALLGDKSASPTRLLRFEDWMAAKTAAGENGKAGV